MTAADIAPVTSAEDIAAIRRLLTEYAASLSFPLKNFAAELAGLPAPYCPPGGLLLLASSGDLPVGVVGLRRLCPTIAEIKRLYVAPNARSGGLGRRLLERALAEARGLGYERVRLDSHRDSMAPAIALYLRLGFSEIPAYGPQREAGLGYFEKLL
ncbi:MAG: GNAT family N-acetyltransferase [Alphaproteobacteria bacterium]|nr:GNAT family N-acetyltransferase [Alphaproteobacteria bacterium]